MRPSTGLRAWGASAIFLLLAILGIFQPKQFQDVQQLFYIGARSTLIIILVGLFTGMSWAFNPITPSSNSAPRALWERWSPFPGPGTRTGADGDHDHGPGRFRDYRRNRHSAHFEQIDALDTMRINPLRYLISPRIAASVISFPILTALFDLIGIVGGYVSVVIVLGVTSNTYFYRVQSSLELKDITDGFIKSIVFALIVSTVCCFQGYFTHMRSDSHGAKADLTHYPPSSSPAC